MEAQTVFADCNNSHVGHDILSMKQIKPDFKSYIQPKYDRYRIGRLK